MEELWCWLENESEYGEVCDEDEINNLKHPFLRHGVAQLHLYNHTDHG